MLYVFQLPPGNGPVVLVLCSGSRSAEFVYEKCCSLLHLAKQTEVKAHLVLGGGCEVDFRVSTTFLSSIRI